MKSAVPIEFNNTALEGDSVILKLGHDYWGHGRSVLFVLHNQGDMQRIRNRTVE